MKASCGRATWVAAFFLLFASAAAAQSYPARPITLLVPFAAGGPADFLGRLLGRKIGEDLGQQIVVDNRPRARTLVGAPPRAQADRDRDTGLMALDGSLVMTP